MSNIISINNLSKTYDLHKEKIEALTGINLNIKQGEKVVIEGESGSGKSTLSKIIAGIESKSSGEVLIFSKPIEKLLKRRKQFYKNIQYVFQNTYETFDPLYTIEHELKRVYKIHHKNISNYNDLVDRYKEIFGLKYLDFKNKYPQELSGGEIQRISIIRSLIIEPKILILDEPTAQLDKKNRITISNIINSKLKDLDALIVITHDKHLIKKKYTSHYIMKDGILKKV